MMNAEQITDITVRPLDEGNTPKLMEMISRLMMAHQNGRIPRLSIQSILEFTKIQEEMHLGYFTSKEDLRVKVCNLQENLLAVGDRIRELYLDDLEYIYNNLELVNSKADAAVKITEAETMRGL